ncbi:MarR family transcriptional regulator [Pseudonocardia sp. GCM10023141]|uniref:MarR family transcriptional regulator n=1 Tax=Pseudonocardia sp. GCM10023141 TaxID=3252653 RepID=UPI003612E719
MDRGVVGHRVHRRYLNAVVLHGLATAAAAGFNATDLYALGVLEQAGPLTAGDIATRTGLTTGAATRLIDRLVRQEVVERVVDPADRRKVVVQPVAHPDAVEQAVDPARRRVGEIIDGYSAAETAILFDYFTRAAAAFEDATEAVRAAQRADG